MAMSNHVIDIVAIFLEDGLVAHIGEHTSPGTQYECGDVIDLDRAGLIDGANESRFETAIVLGWGETEEEAMSMSRSYFIRLAKWHGHEDDLLEFTLFGYDVSQSQVFHDIVSDLDASPPCKRRRM